MSAKEVGGERVGSEWLHQPGLGRLLRTLGLDVAFHRGQGQRLCYRDGDGREREVLDFVSGYGASLLGHAHPQIVAAAQRLATCAVLAPASQRADSEALAGELSARCGGGYHAVFGNSGAEAVEAAVKHAMLETGRREFIALERGFHGKTLGAVQLTDHPFFREPFEVAGLRVRRVAANDVASLEAAFAETEPERLAGMIFEPVQGEGGVRPLTPEFARRASELCRAAGVPLIADECQCGTGRTGQFLASQGLGIRPDYVLLAKSLGGGLAKISAALIDAERYVDGFDLRHSSTFAADAFSSGIARRTLQLLDADALANVTRQGDAALAMLKQLAARFPTVIREVRGVGLMLGVEFHSQLSSSSFLMRLASSRQELVRTIAACLFHRHRVRVAPTISDPWTLRIQPPLMVEEDDWDQLRSGLEDVCRLIESDDIAGLTDFVLDKCQQQPAAELIRSEPAVCRFEGGVVAPERHPTRRPAAPRRVAWLFHMIDADDLIQQDASLRAMGFEAVEQYIDRWSPLASPVVMPDVDVRSGGGERVTLVPIMLPVTSRMVKRWLDRRQTRLCSALIEQAVGVAADLGCQLVSLGQYTSIVTRAGQALGSDTPIGVTSGNSYAIALAVQSLERMLQQRGRDAGQLVLAVVGAAGNIGQATAQLLAPQFRSTWLVGSPRSARRLKRAACEIPRSQISTRLATLRHADVVVSAVNAVDFPVQAETLKPGAIVCDLSVPSSVSDRVQRERPDVTLLRGGIVRLPHGEDLGIASFPLPPGETFACMAEGILLGLENQLDRSFVGPLSHAQVERVAAMAQRHGFELADHKTCCVFGSQNRERTHAATG